MPTHVYVGYRRPPKWWDHLLAHPYEIIIAAYGAVGGVLAVASAFIETLTVSPSLDQLPYPLVAAAGVLLLAGGGGILHGLFDSSEDLGKGFTRERMGLAMSTGGWAVYAVCIAGFNVEAVLSWGLCASIVLANSLRFIATTLQERGIRNDVERGLS